MKKTTAKEKANKVSSKELLVKPAPDIEEVSPEEAPIAAELDPEILKVFIKPKKPKNTIDATDYIPELERDIDEEPGRDTGGF